MPNTIQDTPLKTITGENAKLGDYEGSVSTLCAGCGHDSISFAIIQACFELNIEPHRVAKLHSTVYEREPFLAACRVAA